MEVDRRRFRRLFPRLAEEIEQKAHTISIRSVRSDTAAAERSAMFRSYEPDVIDFIRRCDTEEQALEIIAYLERREEISQEYANRLRKQLQERGVRSFGKKKEEDYYIRKAYGLS